MEIEGIHFTETELELVNLLSDGNWRRTSEIAAYLRDTFSEVSIETNKIVYNYVWRIKKKLANTEIKLICEYRDSKFGYRLVKRLNSEARF